MNEEQALTEAYRRWGQQGMVYDRAKHFNQNGMEDAAKRVGRYWVGTDSFHYGNGNTWEEAFANVNKEKEETNGN